MDINNVTAAAPKVTGAVWRAPLGTTLPTDATSDLDPAFKSLGYVSEDGYTNDNAITTESTKAWGGATVLTTQTDKKDTFKFTLIEAMNVDVLKTVYGDENVTGTLEKGIEVKANNDPHDSFAWVIETVLKGGVLKRTVIPNASVTEVSEISHKSNAAVGYGTTITAMPNSEGDTHYEYIKAASKK